MTGNRLISTPISVDEQRVVSILSQLQPMKAPGPDGLEGHMLKESSAQLLYVGW